MFSGFTQRPYNIYVEPGARVIDVATNDTLAINDSAVVRELSVDIDTRWRYGLRIESDSTVAWRLIRPKYNALALLNLMNVILHPIDHASGCDRYHATAGAYNFRRDEVADSTRELFDSLAREYDGLDVPRGLGMRGPQNRDTWVLSATVRFDVFVFSQSVGVRSSSVNAALGLRPTPWCEAGYDYVGYYGHGIGDVVNASGMIHSGYVLIREPIFGFTFRYGIGATSMSGFRDIGNVTDDPLEPVIQEGVSGRFVVDSYGIGFSNQWVSVEIREDAFRQAMIGSTLTGGRNSSIHVGFNILF